MQKALAATPGVTRAQVNFASETAQVGGSADLEALIMRYAAPATRRRRSPICARPAPSASATTAASGAAICATPA
ncbi:hypothetical protein [Salinicola tamaricis]|uniref:hypothetical protein n=1 Tax=Salinicola tamaricis TaxID=1771309 RepID=UPI0030F3E3C7